MAIQKWLHTVAKSGSYNDLLDKPKITSETSIDNENMIASAKSVKKLNDSVNEVKNTVSSLEANKQNKTDNALKTSDKTIVGGINELKNSINTIRSQVTIIENNSYPTVTATGINSYVGTSNEITSLNKGTKFTLFVEVDATGNCTLNLNEYGIKNIKDGFGNVLNNLKKDIPYNVCYNGMDFILQGKGGGGNATPDKILTGYNATVDSGQITGTMANNGTVNATLNCGQSKVLPKGYINGGTITVNSLASQTQATASAGDILSGKTAIVNGNLVTGNIPTYGSVIASRHGYTGDYFWTQFPKGNFQNAAGDWAGGEARVPKNDICNTLGITANKIVSGQQIAGVWGNASTGARGTFTMPSSTSVTVNVGFQPSKVAFFSTSTTSTPRIKFAIYDANTGFIVYYEYGKSYLWYGTQVRITPFATGFTAYIGFSTDTTSTYEFFCV